MVVTSHGDIDGEHVTNVPKAGMLAERLNERHGGVLRVHGPSTWSIIACG